jgi:hypothetical protein
VLFKSILIVFLMAVPAVLFGADVASDYDRDRDLTDITTYQFAVPAVRHPMDALSADELAEKRMRNAIRESFAQVGLRETAGEPDVLVVYYATLTEKKRIRTTGNGRLGWWGAQSAWADGYVDGMGAIEMLDARSGELIWQGRVTGSITLDNADARTKDGMRRLAKAFKKDRDKQAKVRR